MKETRDVQISTINHYRGVQNEVRGHAFGDADPHADTDRQQQIVQSGEKEKGQGNAKPGRDDASMARSNDAGH